MKRIIPDNRHNSSFEKDREKAKADALAYEVKEAAKKRNLVSLTPSLKLTNLAMKQMLF